jgi:hypothetical protein
MRRCAAPPDAVQCSACAQDGVAADRHLWNLCNLRMNSSHLCGRLLARVRSTNVFDVTSSSWQALG